MTRFNELIKTAMAIIDEGLTILEDAWHWLLGLVGVRTNSDKFTKFGIEHCFVADIDLSTSDPLEARRAAYFQLSRHAPIEPEDLVFDTVWIAECGSWKLVMTRRSLLEARLDQAGNSQGFSARLKSGNVAIFRLPEQRSQWRVQWLKWLSSIAVLILALLLFVGGLLNWQARRESAHLDYETRLYADAEQLRDALNDEESQLPILATGLPEITARLAQIQNAKPQGWIFRQYEWSNHRLTVIFDQADADQSLPSNYVGQFRDLLAPAEVAITRQNAPRSGAQIRIVAVFPERLP